MIRLFAILVLISSFNRAFPQNKTLDSLKLMLTKPMSDTLRFNVLLTLINTAENNEWQNYALQLKNQCHATLKRKDLSPAEKKSCLYYLSSAYHFIGESHVENDVEKALLFFKKSLSISESIPFPDISVSSYYFTGNIYAQKNNFRQASADLFKGLRIAQLNKNNNQKSDMLMSIGELYHLQNDNDTALKYFQLSLAIAEKIKNKQRVFNSLDYIGLIYSGKGNITEAKKHFLKAYYLVKDGNDTSHIAHFLLRIANSFAREKQTDSALFYCQKANNIVGKQVNQQLKRRILSSFSEIYFTKEKFSTALTFAKEALEISKKANYQSQMASDYHFLYKIYKALNKSDEALHYFEQYVAIKDSISSTTSKKHLLEQKLKYEFEKKELLSSNEHIKKINLINLQRERQNKHKNNWLIFSGALTILIALGGGFLYAYQKQSHHISEQKNHILRQKLQLSQMNPHFIFNSLNAIQNYIFKEDRLEAGIYLSKFSELFRQILNFSRKDYITLGEEIDFLNNYMELQQIRFQDKLSYRIIIDPAINREIVYVPPMLAQPFIENSIEHGILNKEGKGYVYISFSKKENVLAYEIEDNGVGLEKAQELKKKLRVSYESLSTMITKERVKDLNSKSKWNVNIDTIDLASLKPNQTGVMVNFSIPYKTEPI